MIYNKEYQELKKQDNFLPIYKNLSMIIKIVLFSN